MARLIIALLIIGAVAFAWQQGWIAKWLNTAVDSGMDSVRTTQRNATKVRPADPGVPESEKK